jgi:hypothetical protein
MPLELPREQLLILRELAGRIGRAFYDVRHVLVIDALTYYDLHPLL